MVRGICMCVIDCGVANIRNLENQSISLLQRMKVTFSMQKSKEKFTECFTPGKQTRSKSKWDILKQQNSGIFVKLALFGFETFKILLIFCRSYQNLTRTCPTQSLKFRDILPVFAWFSTRIL